jgi:pyridoxamine 5'-phosphate oxidase
MQNPIERFNALWRRAVECSPLKQRSAICLSTIGQDGFPNSRFVDLKEADHRGLVFCSYLDSVKGRDISRNPKAGLTVWWDHIGVQVRFQGTCVRIADEDADRHWRSRSRDAQLTTTTFQQSEPLESPESLQSTLEAARLRYHGSEIQRPVTWGGFRLLPAFVEILEFREDRLHVRTCYAAVGEAWKLSYLQP